MIFLVEYNRRGGHRVSLTTFSDSELDKAEESLLQLELDLNRRGLLQDNEVVLFKADSLDAFKRTHGRYFMDIEALIQRMNASQAPLEMRIA